MPAPFFFCVPPFGHLPTLPSHVPESVLKKRAAADKARKAAVVKKALLKKKNQTKRQLIFNKAAAYATEYKKVRGCGAGGGGWGCASKRPTTPTPCPPTSLAWVYTASAHHASAAC